MKRIFKPGDTKTYMHKVHQNDIAAFHGETVHPVYSTFALARDMEWSSRLFMLEIIDDDEQGIGTALQITHQSPAFLDQEVTITATIESWEGHELICRIEAKVGERIIAKGSTGQKVLKKEKIEQLMARHRPK